MATYKRRQLVALRQALDEARFGSERTLNLRAALPSADDAARRAEAWLREKQAAAAGEVLIVTGRGNQSPGGVSVVREAVRKVLASLKRRGVVRLYHEHTPGSYIVTVAPMREVVEAPRRRRERERLPPAADPPELAALDEQTRAQLRDLARRALETLGVRDPEPFLDAEMLKQFGAIAAGVPEGPDREGRLRQVIIRAIDEYDEHA
jgi:hypothetical protein